MEQELYMKEMKKIATISLSGGLDSTSLLLHLLNKNFKIFALSFDYGQKHRIELTKAKFITNLLKSKKLDVIHKIIDISDAISILDSSLTSANIKIPEGYYKEENMKSTVVPNRNAIFLSFLYANALSLHKKYNKKIELSLGVHSGDHEIYPDCRLGFYNKIFDAFKEGNWHSENINLYLPYINLNKGSIIKDALQSCKNLNLDFNYIFGNTITSYNPNNKGVSDGRTASDIERILAFNEVGIKDPLCYNQAWEVVLKHALKIEKTFND